MVSTGCTRAACCRHSKYNNCSRHSRSKLPRFTRAVSCRQRVSTASAVSIVSTASPHTCFYDSAAVRPALACRDIAVVPHRICVQNLLTTLTRRRLTRCAAVRRRARRWPRQRRMRRASRSLCGKLASGMASLPDSACQLAEAGRGWPRLAEAGRGWPRLEP